MSEEENPEIVMTWSSESYASEHHEPDDLVYETSGDLFAVDDNDDRRFAGKFRIYYVDVERAIDEGEPIFDALDAHSSHLAEYFEPIFGSEAPDFSNRLLGLFDHELHKANLLILDRLEILPQYRGKGLGLSVLRHLVSRFSSGVGGVAMKPFPLQFETAPSSEDERKWRSELGLDQFEADEDLAEEKLCRYYSKLGFLCLDRSPMMVKSTAWSAPPYEDA